MFSVERRDAHYLQSLDLQRPGKTSQEEPSHPGPHLDEMENPSSWWPCRPLTFYLGVGSRPFLSGQSVLQWCLLVLAHTPAVLSGFTAIKTKTCCPLLSQQSPVCTTQFGWTLLLPRASAGQTHCLHHTARGLGVLLLQPHLPALQRLA